MSLVLKAGSVCFVGLEISSRRGAAEGMGIDATQFWNEYQPNAYVYDITSKGLSHEEP